MTAALPYANGDIHIGHLVEYLQADIWTRYQKLKGHECLYICADDTHGTPIMVNARKQGITPEELINASAEKHIKDFTDFNIEFDHYGSTNSSENQKVVNEIYKALADNDHVHSKTIEQSFCEHDNMFLPDRFIKGTCPKCKTEDQYGDSCESCSATYNTTDLIGAQCTICGNIPILKDSEHVFLKLNNFKDFLCDWVKDHTQTEVANKLQEWLKDDLREWDISRDAPYFGFEIPGHPGKYFYVWVDAPVGYISSTQQWCEKNNKDYLDYWKNDDCEIYHIIGKDIIYFHTLFWPAMLKASGFNTPNQVWVHGMLKVNGVKMSKSRGTFLNARTFLNHMDPTYLRFYYATKLGAGLDDIDLNFQDFVDRVNSELIGKITNLGSRGAQMLNKKLDGNITTLDEEGHALVKAAQERAKPIGDFFENREYLKAMQAIREIADEANRYFDEKKPWIVMKEDPEATRPVLTCILNLFRIAAIYLKPVIPEYTKKVEKLFKEEPYDWHSAQYFLENHTLNKFDHLAQRIELKTLEAMVDEQKSFFEKQ